MEAPTLLRDLHWTPLEGPGSHIPSIAEHIFKIRYLGLLSCPFFSPLMQQPLSSASLYIYRIYHSIPQLFCKKRAISHPFVL